MRLAAAFVLSLALQGPVPPPPQLPPPNTLQPVTLHLVVDEEYRALFPDHPALYAHLAALVAEVNRDANEWGLDFIPATGCKWDSDDSADLVALLEEAWQECGGTWRSCIMVAFTAQATPLPARGVAALGQPRALIRYDADFLREASTLEHELLHTYGLLHCCATDCVMQARGYTPAMGQLHEYLDVCSDQDHARLLRSQQFRYCR